MIVVTAPTGQIGSRLVKNLLAVDDAVRIVVRDPARVPSDIREKVDIVTGSHGDTRIVKNAFRNADAVFWVVPPDPKAKSVEAAYVDFSRPGCDAFRSEEVKHVVGVSSLGRGKPGLLGFGRSEAMAQAVVDMTVAVNRGIYRNAHRTVESRSATTFRQWCEEVLRPALLD